MAQIEKAMPLGGGSIKNIVVSTESADFYGGEEMYDAEATTTVSYTVPKTQTIYISYLVTRQGVSNYINASTKSFVLKHNDTVISTIMGEMYKIKAAEGDTIIASVVSKAGKDESSGSKKLPVMAYWTVNIIAGLTKI